MSDPLNQIREHLRFLNVKAKLDVITPGRLIEAKTAEGKTWYFAFAGANRDMICYFSYLVLPDRLKKQLLKKFTVVGVN